MPKSWFTVQAAKDAPKAGEVSIRGYIGDWGVNDRDLIAAVEALGDIENLTVRINSRGGEVDHAISIFNFLRDHAAHVTTINEGVAMSSGSLILLAGDTIKVRKNSITMVHNPSVFAAGNAKALRDAAEMLDKFEVALRAVYVARTGKSDDEIKAMLDGPNGDGVFMTAAEAKKEGFADEVVSIEEKKAEPRAMAYAAALGIPEDVLARVEAAEADDQPNPDDEAARQRAEAEAKAAADELARQAAQNQPETFAAQANAVIVAAGLSEFAGVFLVDTNLKTVDELKAAVAQAREVRAICDAAKLPNMAAELIRSRATLEDARKRLCDALADADEETHTDGTQRNPSKPATTARPAALKTADVYGARRKQLH